MKKNDRLIEDVLREHLEEREVIVHKALLTATAPLGERMVTAAMAVVAAGAFGGVGVAAGTFFFAAATDRRLILIPKKWRVKAHECASIAYANIASASQGGFPRRLTLTMRDGQQVAFQRVWCFFEPVAGHKTFLERVPDYVTAWNERKR